MKVLKFGGSSLANFQRFEAARKTINHQRKSSPVAVVLSAPKGVTNGLVAMADLASKGKDFTALFHQTKSFLEDLISPVNSSDLKSQIELILSEIHSLLEGVQKIKLCPPSIEAKIITRGEIISCTLMQKLLPEGEFLDPVTHFICDGPSLNSSVDIEKSRPLFNKWKNKSLIIMPGFMGGNASGEVVTLGRNGSDYSASALAACINAQACEIWTDVDGIYNVDPNKVPEAKLIPRLSYQEAMELSYFGAKVLHPKTIAPISQFKIPCLIKNSMAPDAPGSEISDKTDLSSIVKGITYLEHLAMIDISGPGMKGVVGIAARVFETLARHSISILLISQSASEYGISFCVPMDVLEIGLQALNNEFSLELKNGLIDPIESRRDLANISIVGEGMKQKRGVAARFFKALAQANVNIVAIAQDSSERSISAVIKQSMCESALKICHQNFFSSLQSIDLFLIGCGQVGSELLNQVAKQKAELLQKNIDLRTFMVANSKKMLLKPESIDLDHWKSEFEKTTDQFSVEKIAHFIDEHSLINPVIVDCTSSEIIAKQYLNFLDKGLHIVTPNKKANTLSNDYYLALKKKTLETNRLYLYEATVGAGLPVIETWKNLLHAGDQLIELEGILSGSLSYIFGQLDEGISLSEATRKAKEKGYTEPDPRDDLSGMDVARKILIMARENGIRLELKDIKVESILPEHFDATGDVNQFMTNLPKIDQEIAKKLAQIHKEGKRLRYVGSISEGVCKVAIKIVDSTHPLYDIKEGENALSIKSRYYNPIPLVIRGYGAGNAVTAAGVFSDIMRTLSRDREL